MIALLGRFQVMRGDQAVHGIESDRGRALLAYLAVERDRAHRRDSLGALLWPTADAPHMRQNLRRALYNLRQTLDPPAGQEPLLLVTTQDVQLNPRYEYQLDVMLFRRLLEASQTHDHATLATCPACHQRLAEATALYQGDFLSGFSLPQNERFEEWRLFTQEALHVTMLDALTSLARFHTARQEDGPAIAYLQRQIELEPWREEAHCALMRLFAQRGERSAALAQYALCARLLAEELGAPPAPETEQLYAQIVRGELEQRPPTPLPVLAPARPAPIATVALPAAVTPFIGRQRELGLIRAQLLDPGCRLLTIVGLGGVGKTQLALTAAHALTTVDTDAPCCPDGIYFIALADLAAPQTPTPLAIELQIAAAIAHVVGLELQADRPLIDQLCAYLRDKAVLLLLDNYEHLLGGADLVSHLLSAAPRLKVLVTSRLGLGQAEEWRLPLEGLSVPTTASGDDLMHYESVALFVQWAQRKQATFVLDGDNQAAVVEIAQLVDGLPLGIVLAAACYPELTCAEISQEIRRNLIILTAAATTAAEPAVELNARHRSIQAVFEASWQLLTPPEQRLLGRAAIFQGGFTRQAGLQITGATLGELSALVARVLLRRTSAGRYMMHELLRQFAAAKLDTSDDVQANEQRARHSHYYLDWTAHQAPALQSSDLPHVLVAMRTELPNLRVAWQWAVQAQRQAWLVESIDPLTEFYATSGLLSEAEALFSASLALLQEQAATPDHLLCEAKLAIALTHMLYDQGNLPAAERWLARTQGLTQATADPDLIWHRLRLLLQLRMAQGAYDEADHLMGQVLAAAQQTADPQWLARAWLDQGKLALARHRYAEAQAAVEEALRLSDKGVNPLVQETIFRFLGLAAYYQGEMAHAKAYDEQGLQLARMLGSRLRMADQLLHLGAVHDALGDYGAAQAAYTEALAIYRDRGSRQHEIAVLGNLGISTAYLGNYASAIRYTQQALDLQRVLGKVNQSAIAFTNLALFHHQLGEQTTAVDYAQQGIAAAQAEGDRYIEGFAQTFRGHAQSALGAWAAAAAAYNQALACYTALGLDYLAPEPQAGLARLSLAQGDIAAARRAIEPILNLLTERPLAGVEEPMRVYHTCYQVLAAWSDAQAIPLLEQAHRQLQARAAQIQDDGARDAFLHQVAAHRALIVDYAMTVGQDIHGG